MLEFRKLTPGVFPQPTNPAPENWSGWGRDLIARLQDQFANVANTLSIIGTSIHIRELLTANRTYYVAPAGSGGSNSNNGLTAATPFLTLQHAYDVIQSTLDFAGFTVTIQLLDGTYTTGLYILSGWAGGGSLYIQGNATTPASVHINTTNGQVGGIRADVPLPGAVVFRNMKVTASNTAAVYLRAAGFLTFNNLIFGLSISWHIVADAPGAYIQCYGSDYSIVGGGAYGHVLVLQGGSVLIGANTVTLTGSPNSTFTLFVMASRLGSAIIGSTYTITGSVTGTRFFTEGNGIIYSNGTGPDYLPGSFPGVNSTGGQYI